MAMFGLLAVGRLVQTNYDKIGEKQLVITIPEADNIDHVVVFLTGAVAFPEGYGGLVYFSWPDSSKPSNWQLVGIISNEKPTSIIKIAGTKKEVLPTLAQSGFLTFGHTNISHNAHVGISIETIDVVLQQSQLLTAEKVKIQSEFVEYAQKMLESFRNYCRNRQIHTFQPK